MDKNFEHVKINFSGVPRQSCAWKLNWGKDSASFFRKHKYGYATRKTNEIAALIWQMCDGKRNIADIQTDLNTLYPESHESISRDLRMVLIDLISAGLVIGNLIENDAIQTVSNSVETGIGEISIERLFPDNRMQAIAPLRQCQLVMARMLQIFDYICRNNSIEYFLTDGALLGAMRNQAFVPYDGDIDVGMLPEDFERFRSVSKNLLPKDIFLQDSVSDPDYNDDGTIFKLRDRYSSYWEFASQFPDLKYHHGLQIDIVVWERTGNQLSHWQYREAQNYSDVFPLGQIEFEGFFPQCPGYPERWMRKEIPDFKTPYTPDKQFPHEGEASAVIPCNHPMSLDYPHRPD